MFFIMVLVRKELISCYINILLTETVSLFANEPPCKDDKSPIYNGTFKRFIFFFKLYIFIFGFSAKVTCAFLADRKQ